MHAYSFKVSFIIIQKYTYILLHKYKGTYTKLGSDKIELQGIDLTRFTYMIEKHFEHKTP